MKKISSAESRRSGRPDDQDLPQAAPSGAGRRVLVVDHESEAVGIVALMCNLLECTSTTATSLNEALELVKTQTFDLIITDYYLPPDNALILLHEVRHLRPGLPAILMTEDPRIADLTRSFSLNIVETLIKPFSRSALEKALAKVWARKNPQ